MSATLFPARRPRFGPLLPALGLLLGGCIASHFCSTLNPRYEGMQYQRILVQFVDFQPDLSQYGEQAFQDEMARVCGDLVQCYTLSQLGLPAGLSKEKFSGEIWKFEVEKKIDAVLVCFNARRTQGDLNQYKDMYCRLELFDLRTNQSVWYSQSSMDTNSVLYNYQDMLHNFARDAVDDLHTKGLLGIDNRPAFIPSNTANPPGTNI
jgi:hypothetical protein